MRTLTAADGTAVYFKAIVFNLLVQLFGSIVLSIVTTAATVGENAYMTLNFVLMALIQAVFFLAVYSSVRKKKLALAYPVRPVKWFIALSAFLSSVVCILCFALPAQWFYLLLEKAGYSFSDPVSFGAFVRRACFPRRAFRRSCQKIRSRSLGAYFGRGFCAYAHESRTNRLSVFLGLRVRLVCDLLGFGTALDVASFGQ